MKPLEHVCQNYTNDLINVYVGKDSQRLFLKSMEHGNWQVPSYLVPVGKNIEDCEWHCALCKNVSIVGNLERDALNKFADLLLDVGALSVVGIDENNKLFLKNANIFRMKGQIC